MSSPRSLSLRRRYWCSLVAFSAAIAVMVQPDPAAAQDTRAAAVQLFDAAQALVKERRFDEACPKFAESYRLDPQLGALLHYGDCLEQGGKLASAYAAFRDAAELAQQKGDERKSVAEDRAKALEPRLSRLTVEVAPAARVSGLEVLRDGTPITEAMFGMPIAVDGGRHTVEARAPGHKTLTINVALRSEGEHHRVVVPALDAEAAAAAPAPTPTPATTPAPAPQDTPAPSHEGGGVPAVTWIAGGVAVVGLGLGITFNMLARRANDDAENACMNSAGYDVCVVPSESQRESRESNQDLAKSNATLSYVSFGVAGAAAATAIITLIASSSSSSSSSSSASSSSLQLAPAVGARAGGLNLRGSF